MFGSLSRVGFHGWIHACLKSLQNTGRNKLALATGLLEFSESTAPNSTRKHICPNLSATLHSTHNAQHIITQHSEPWVYPVQNTQKKRVHCIHCIWLFYITLSYCMSQNGDFPYQGLVCCNWAYHGKFRVPPWLPLPPRNSRPCDGSRNHHDPLNKALLKPYFLGEVA